jgi:CheY-like chemotaxis protein
LSLQLPSEPILVHGDRTRLVQVMTNLLTNAAKFTPRGGYISVVIELVGGGVSIRVRDTGVGIAKEAQGRVFELFAQEENSLARSQGGLGIGLTLARQIIELHGGRVELESGGKDKGTEVRVSIPALSLAALLDRGVEGDKQVPQGAGLRVLVIDDNIDSAESFKMLLELSGHRVETAHDGLSALRAVDEFDPHVCFVDLGLPGLDGFEVARRILQQRHKPPVLIALSGYGREEDKAQTKAVGFHHHLVKPVDYNAVLAYLASLGATTIAQGRSLMVH